MSVIYLPSELKESRVPSFASLQQDFTPLKPGKPGGWRRMQSFAHLPGRVLLNQLWCPRLPSLPSTRQHFPQFHQRSSNTHHAAAKQSVISSVCHNTRLSLWGAITNITDL